MLVIGIAGGSGSGKTTVAKKIIKGLPDCSVTIISQDSYYKDSGHLSDAEKKQINFDHPDAIEFSLLNKHIDELREGNTIEKPKYSYITCARSEETISVEPKKVIIVEGILVLVDKDLRDRMDIMVYVDADADDRLMRIMQRDLKERGRDYDQVIRHYQTYVKPMHLQFIETSKRNADIIVPMGGNNEIAIDILKAKISEQLK
jgi:uridine kinase